MGRFFCVEVANHEENNRLDEVRRDQDTVIDSRFVKREGVSDEDRNLENYYKKQNNCFDFQNQNFPTFKPYPVLDLHEKHRRKDQNVQERKYHDNAATAAVNLIVVSISSSELSIKAIFRNE